jgi:CRP-like cAMP-binding protein
VVSIHELMLLSCQRSEPTMSFSSDYFIHAGNILLLVAYSVRDILWLRLFAVAAALMSIPYFALQPIVLWAPLGWTILFAGINLFQSWLLFIERRPIRMTAEEEEVRRLVFKNLPPRKVLQLLSIGSWVTVERGERVIKSGNVPDTVSLIVHGKVRVMKNGRDLGVMGAGSIAGSALILTGVSADFDAIVEEPIRSVRWQVETLQKYLEANPETRTEVQRHLARDLAGKVQHLANDSSDLQSGDVA